MTSDSIQSCPLKLILVGEHFVLNGGEALAIPLLKHRAKLEKGQITADIPSGFGAGFSAAKAILNLRQSPHFSELSEAQRLEALQIMEDQSHGKASGIDHLTMWHESPVLISKEGAKVLSKDLLKSPLLKNCRLFLSGPTQETTKEMVSISQAYLKKHPTFTSKLPKASLCLKALQNNKSEEFKSILNAYGQALEQIGVVDKKTQALCSALRAKGFAAKVCGAGGHKNASGLVLLFHEDESRFNDLSLDFILL